MHITEEEIIEYLSCRRLNTKTNNYIITNVDDFSMAEKIPDTSNVTFSENDLDIDTAINVRVDFKEVNIHNVLTYILNYLKELNLLDASFAYEIDFNDKFAIPKFQKVLRTYNRVIQIICINTEYLSREDQMLFNELYYFYSVFYSVITFTHKEFKTYFLSNERVLDYRENYTKLELISREIKNDENELKRLRLTNDNNIQE